jgi:Tfp pilus assembly protein PilF
METATSRRNVRRSKSRAPVFVAIAVVVVVVIALVVGVVGWPGKDKGTPAAGTTGAANSATALLNKALSEMNSGDLSKAKIDLVQVSKLSPQNKYAYYNLGYIAQTQGSKAEAEAQYKLALAIDAKYDPALYNLAILRVGSHDANGAIVLYRQAIASNPKDASAHFNLGLLLRQTGHTPEGNTEVQAAVKLTPSLKAQAQAQGVPIK